MDSNSENTQEYIYWNMAERISIQDKYIEPLSNIKFSNRQSRESFCYIQFGQECVQYIEILYILSCFVNC